MPQPFRLVGDPGTAAGRFLFTCEHASNRLIHVSPTPADQALLDDHWGYDPGAAAVTEALAATTDSVAVLSDFSRLLVDPNRPEDSDTLVVTACAGQPVSFNQGLGAMEIAARIEALHRPYHRAVAEAGAACLARRPVYFMSIHSFTPVHSGVRREMEIGVLFDDFEADAVRLAEALSEEGFATALNEPYSGRDGLCYAIERHARALGAPHLELEIRNDLLASPKAVASVARRIERALAVLSPAGSVGGAAPG